MKKTNYFRLLGILLYVFSIVACSSDDSAPDTNPMENEENNDDSVQILDGETLLFELDENPSIGYEIGSIPAAGGSSAVFSLTMSDTEGALEIDPESGVIRVLDSLLFDFEQRTVIQASGSVTDGQLTVNHPIEIQILDLEERYSYFGTKWLTSQTEVDLFGAEGHIGVSGVLYIRSSIHDPIVNLVPLSSIKSVGSLFINQLDHRSIELNNLEYIENNFEIQSTRDLLNVGNLSISYIGGDVIINDNTHLQSLEGLDVEEIGGSVMVLDNPRLTSMNGVVLDHIRGDLHIEKNISMYDLEGMENLQRVDGDLRIANMHYIQDLDELNGLNMVSGHLEIVNNQLLEDFCGITSLVQTDGLGGDYRVIDNEYNPSLQQLLDGDCSL